MPTSLIFLLACLSPSGCAMYQNVGIDSRPPGAEIFLDGESVGHTPARLPIGRVIDHSVYLKKDGYQPRLVVLTFHPEDDGIHFLTPADVRVPLAPLPDSMDRDVDIEIEEDDKTGP